MRLLTFTLLVTGCALAQPTTSTDASSTNKISSTKSTSNTIQGTSQKTSSQQPHPPFVSQFVIPKAAPQSSQAPAPMYILAQPGALAVHGPAFQQAVNQLLNYYNTNPQARYQLLHQQHPNLPATFQAPHPQAPENQFPAGIQQIPQHVQMPSGALHVIPSPQLTTQHLAAAPVQANVQYALAVPAQGHFALGPGFVAQFPQGLPPQHAAPIPVQIPIQSLGGAQALLGHGLSGQAILAHPLPTQLFPSQLSGGQGSSSKAPSGHGNQISTTLSTTSSSSSSSSSNHALPQPQALTQSLPSQSSINHQPTHITAQQIVSQLPSQYTTSAQLAQYQPQAGFPSSLPIASISPHGQFGLKSHPATQIFATNDYLSQTEKSVQPSGSNYNPVYRATYIKG